MGMKRKIYDALLEWKDHNWSQSLLLKGSRQVGKTYIVKKFGKEEFHNLLYINFEDQQDMKKIFDQIPNPDEAVKTLQAYGLSKNIFSIEGKDTLIFMDEIQLCKRAYSLLKPLTETGRFRIVSSGSLLGIALCGDFLDPGPSVHHLEMMPMDFEEFLWAVHGPEIGPMLETVRSECKRGNLINEALHSTLNRDLRDYIIVGGMPRAVIEFVQNKDLGKVFLKQAEIVSLYRSDIQRYQTTQDAKMKTLKCFESIPNQFSKENHRFVYSAVEPQKSARDYENSIDWLEKTGNARMCYHVDHFRGSLIDGKGKLFKLYLNDIGLLVCMLGKEYVFKIQNNELGLFKGAIYEQLLAQMLQSKNIPLYYARIGEYEIDFLVESEGGIIPVECKSGGSTKSKSLQNYVKTFTPHKAFKISSNNVNISDGIIKAIPHYAFALLGFEDMVRL